MKPFIPDRLKLPVSWLVGQGVVDMRRAAAVAVLVFFSLAGVAYADSPGGWSQFDAMTRPQGRVTMAPVQEVQQAKPVYEFAVGQKGGTSLSPANPNEAASN